MSPEELKDLRARIWRSGSKARQFCPTDTLDAMMPEVEKIIQEAVDVEREACARVADELDSHPERPHRFEVGNAIRDRGRESSSQQDD